MKIKTIWGVYRPAVLQFALSAFLVFVFAGPAAAGTVTRDTNQEVAEFFQKSKKNEAFLIAFLHKMPKGADLHNHPSGAVNTETLLDKAIMANLFFDRQTKSFVETCPDENDGSGGRCYAADDLKFSFWKMGEVLDALSMRNMAKQPENGHDHFFRVFERYGLAEPTPEAKVRELIERARGQRISYMELMVDPVVMADGSMDIEGTMALVSQLEAENEKVNLEARKAFEADGRGEAAWETELAYILTLNRNGVKKVMADGRKKPTLDGYEAFFRANVQKALKGAVTRPSVRGVTILSAEDAWVSRTQFDLQMKIIDEEWKKLQGDYPGRPKMNLHGGELTLEYAPYETMRNRISRTIELGHAARIGHGVDIMWEDDVYGLLKQMRDQKIAVEICLTSNEGILNVAGGDRHPFLLYWEAGVPVTLNTDDEGISRSNLTMEFAKAAQWFDLSYGELKWLAFSSLEYSFLPGESMFIDGDFNRPKEPKDFPKASQKAIKQQRLYDDFIKFEKKMLENMTVF